MAEVDSPTCAVDLRDPSNCLNIAMAKPGQEIRMLVRSEENATAAKFMEAVGTLSNNGEPFSVVVTRTVKRDVLGRFLSQFCVTLGRTSGVSAQAGVTPVPSPAMSTPPSTIAPTGTVRNRCLFITPSLLCG